MLKTIMTAATADNTPAITIIHPMQEHQQTKSSGQDAPKKRHTFSLWFISGKPGNDP
jgi:hypothetical protein